MRIIKFCRRSDDLRGIFARNRTCRRYILVECAVKILKFNFVKTFDVPIFRIQTAVLHPVISSTNHENSMMVEIGTEY